MDLNARIQTEYTPDDSKTVWIIGKGDMFDVRCCLPNGNDSWPQAPNPFAGQQPLPQFQAVTRHAFWTCHAGILKFLWTAWPLHEALMLLFWWFRTFIGIIIGWTIHSHQPIWGGVDPKRKVNYTNMNIAQDRIHFFDFHMTLTITHCRKLI